MRIGKFEHANGGTLFLDEIESMAMTTQIPLLRVLQERAIERLGSNKSLPLDIRVLAATKVDLKTAAERNKAVQVLLKHDWPGNIRELRNIAERYVLLGESFKFDLNALMHSNQHEEGLTLPFSKHNY